MLETCPRCGEQYLPMAGEPGCPKCRAAGGEAEGWRSIDEDWGEVSDLPTPPPPPLQLVRPPGKVESAPRQKAEQKTEAGPPREPAQNQVATALEEAGDAAERGGRVEAERATGQARRRTRAKGKRRGRPPSQPAQPVKVKKRRAAPPSPVEKKAEARQRPVWLLPVLVLLAAILVVALAIIASRGKG